MAESFSHLLVSLRTIVVNSLMHMYMLDRIWHLAVMACVAVACLRQAYHAHACVAATCRRRMIDPWIDLGSYVPTSSSIPNSQRQARYTGMQAVDGSMDGNVINMVADASPNASS